MKNNLSNEERKIIWSIIKRIEKNHEIIEDPYNYPRFRVKCTSSGGYNFWCNACNEIHHIPKIKNNRFSLTDFNGNLFKPTFYLKNTKKEQFFITKTMNNICCYNISNGNIHYLNESTHHLAGISMRLEEYDNWKTINISYKSKL